MKGQLHHSQEGTYARYDPEGVLDFNNITGQSPAKTTPSRNPCKTSQDCGGRDSDKPLRNKPRPWWKRSITGEDVVSVFLNLFNCIIWSPPFEEDEQMRI
jgi:hypothetical protein